MVYVDTQAVFQNSPRGYIPARSSKGRLSRKNRRMIMPVLPAYTIIFKVCLNFKLSH